jgi:hypothetical protein
MTDMTTGDPLIIAAGYHADMARFLDANEGLKRRFGLTFDFPNFELEDLAQMFLQKVTTQGFAVGNGVTREAVARLIQVNTGVEWRNKANGGVAEKLARLSMRFQDARLDPTAIPLEEYRQQASTIELQDVARAAEQLVDLAK